MTFPLGSLRSDTGGSSASSAPSATPASHAGYGGTYTRNGGGAPSAAAEHHPAGWKAQLMLLGGGVAWLLALLALATHNPADAAFSTSGSSAATLNKAGALGAWFSDLSFFLVGYSTWWLMAIGAREWLGGLARVLRGGGEVEPSNK